MKKEIVFEILGEGGGICIIRQTNNYDVKFIYQHSEIDPTDEGLEVNVNDEFSNFDEPFQLVSNRYPWHMLYVNEVHEDFRDLVIEKLIKRLNDDLVSTEYFNFSKGQLEQILNIKLISNLNEKNEPNWRHTLGCEREEFDIISI